LHEIIGLAIKLEVFIHDDLRKLSCITPLDQFIARFIAKFIAKFNLKRSNKPSNTLEQLAYALTLGR
jgi:hypothetical protein